MTRDTPAKHPFVLCRPAVDLQAMRHYRCRLEWRWFVFKSNRGEPS